MPPKTHKLLERMRTSKSGWKRRDLDNLYDGFGFVITHGSKHDIVKHPDFPKLRATLPRHSKIAKGYVQVAIKLVDQLLDLEEATNEKGNAPDSQGTG